MQPWTTLLTAQQLQTYLIEKGGDAQRFAQTLSATGYIAPEAFRDYADELRQDAGRVTAALDIDLDRGTFSTLAGGEGWQTYTVRDVCVAAWQATIYCAATFLRNSSFVVASQKLRPPQAVLIFGFRRAVPARTLR